MAQELSGFDHFRALETYDPNGVFSCSITLQIKLFYHPKILKPQMIILGLSQSPGPQMFLVRGKCAPEEATYFICVHY